MHSIWSFASINWPNIVISNCQFSRFAFIFFPFCVKLFLLSLQQNGTTNGLLKMISVEFASEYVFLFQNFQRVRSARISILFVGLLSDCHVCIKPLLSEFGSWFGSNKETFIIWFKENCVICFWIDYCLFGAMITVVQQHNIWRVTEFVFHDSFVDIQQPIQWLSQQHTVIQIHSAEVFDHDETNQVWLFGRLSPLEIVCMKDFVVVGHLSEPFLLIGVIEVSDFPSLTHQFVIVTVYFYVVSIIGNFCSPPSPQYFRQPVWFILICLLGVYGGNDIE